MFQRASVTKVMTYRFTVSCQCVTIFKQSKFIINEIIEAARSPLFVKCLQFIDHCSQSFTSWHFNDQKYFVSSRILHLLHTGSFVSFYFYLYGTSNCDARLIRSHLQKATLLSFSMKLPLFWDLICFTLHRQTCAEPASEKALEYLPAWQEAVQY